VISIYTTKPDPKPGMAALGLAAMGRYSYTIYLWHVPVAVPLAWVAARAGVPPRDLLMPHAWTIHSGKVYLAHAAYLTAAIAVGIVFSKLIEIPVLRLRDRLTRDNRNEVKSTAWWAVQGSNLRPSG
jgi:peptidoglycan/LPS O-acetylase OafA/YrhL